MPGDLHLPEHQVTVIETDVDEGYASLDLKEGQQPPEEGAGHPVPPMPRTTDPRRRRWGGHDATDRAAFFGSRGELHAWNYSGVAR